MKKSTLIILALLVSLCSLFISCHAEVNEMVTNLEANIVGNTYILSWDPVDDASQYVVYEVYESYSSSNSSVSEYNLVEYKRVSNTYCTVRSDYASNYEFCVGAIIDGKESFLSERVSFN